jgi:uncharacterized protein YciI
MFIVDLNYKSPIKLIEKHIQEHKDYLDEHFTQRIFLLSGPKVPRTGGIILANCESKTDLMRIIKEDPFYKNNMADYSIIEFKPTKKAFKDF